VERGGRQNQASIGPIVRNIISPIAPGHIFLRTGPPRNNGLQLISQNHQATVV
jgi:hypothetical protein